MQTDIQALFKHTNVQKDVGHRFVCLFGWLVVCLFVCLFVCFANHSLRFAIEGAHHAKRVKTPAALGSR